MKPTLTRRDVITGGTIAVAGTAVAVAAQSDRLLDGALAASETLTIRTQRLLLRRQPRVREFKASDISAHFPTNGTKLPAGERYAALAANGFRNWSLRIDGLVKQPLSLTLAEIMRLETRSQTTMHCCDEGWSAIAQWAGVPLGALLSLAGLLPRAQYVVFHCFDQKEEDHQYYYESIDLFDAFHPQTILAHQMNGRTLPVDYGAPLRLRIETQIGYKNAKYIDRIEVVDHLDRIGQGRGGWWEDFDGAVWYAGQ
jgi:DMSO/TMAO reductase YedYZ molybdopterin-dependent catalytic subunit